MATNIIIPVAAIQDMLQSMTVCRKCRRIMNVTLSVATVRISSMLTWKCATCDTLAAFGDKKSCKENATGGVSVKCSKRGDELSSLNLRLVLAMEMLGFGQSGAATVAAMLSLNKNFFKFQYTTIEENISLVTTELAKQVVQKNLEKEVQATNEGGSEPVGIGVAGDTSWNKRSTGYSYSSDSGTHFLIGLETKKIVAYCAMSRRCSKCERGSPRDDHNQFCSKNYEGSSGGMEATGALRNTLQVMNSSAGCFVSKFVMDDDSTTKAILQGQQDGGSLPNNHPIIEFMAHVNHRIKLFTSSQT